MGLRFRKVVRLFPGVRLNFSGGRLSATVGVPGASLNLGTDGRAHVTLGIPGTGLSYRASLAPPQPRSVPGALLPKCAPVDRQFSPQPTSRTSTALPGEIQSASVSKLTSAGLASLKRLVNDVARRQRELHQEITARKRSFSAWRLFTSFSKLFVVRLFTFPWIARFEEKTETHRIELEAARKALELTKIELDFDFDERTLGYYGELRQAYDKLRSSYRIWDVTSEVATNRYVERTTAYKSVMRKLVRLELSRSNIVKARWEALHFGNANGEDLHIFPGFVLVKEAGGQIALIDIVDLDVRVNEISFIEDEAVPGDARVVAQTWKKANKDGSRDKRFNNNHQIPIVRYGDLTIRSSTGINEAYMVSNADAVLAFGHAFSRFAQALSEQANRNQSVAPAHDSAEPTSVETVLEIVSDGAAPPPKRPRLVFDAIFAVVIVVAGAWFTNSELQGATTGVSASYQTVQDYRVATPAEELKPATPAAASPVTASSAPPPLVAATPVTPPAAPPPSSDKVTVDKTRPADVAAREAVDVRAQSANLRLEPNGSATIIRTARKGEHFMVFNRNGEWVQVGDNEATGWIHRSVLEPVRGR